MPDNPTERQSGGSVGLSGSRGLALIPHQGHPRYGTRRRGVTTKGGRHSPSPPAEKSMVNRLLLIVGSGRCGLLSMVNVLNRQPGAKVSCEEPPLLPWRADDRPRLLANASPAGERGAAKASWATPLRSTCRTWRTPGRRTGLARHRPEAAGRETVASFIRFLDEYNAFPTNHWAEEPGLGRYHDPLWTAVFRNTTQPTARKVSGATGTSTTTRWRTLPKSIPTGCVFDMAEAMNTEAGQKAVLDFAGFPEAEQVLAVGTRVSRPSPIQRGPSAARLEASARPGQVRGAGPVFRLRPCGLRAGVARVGAARLSRAAHGRLPAIDQGRNQMATDALIDGFDETMWIDSDVEFHPDSVDQLRAQGLPICCGVYPQKGRRGGLPRPAGDAAGHFRQGRRLERTLICGAGFLHVRRHVYLKVQHKLRLPITNIRFGSPMIRTSNRCCTPLRTGRGIWRRTTPSASEPGSAASRSSRTRASVCGTLARTLTAGKTRGSSASGRVVHAAPRPKAAKRGNRPAREPLGDFVRSANEH